MEPTSESFETVDVASQQERIHSLTKELETSQSQLSLALKRAEKAERQYDSMLRYNDDLRKQVDSLSRKLHQCKNAARNKEDKGTQIVEGDFPCLTGSVAVTSTDPVHRVLGTVPTESNTGRSESLSMISRQDANHGSLENRTRTNNTAVEYANIHDDQVSAGTRAGGEVGARVEAEAGAVSLAESLRETAEAALQETGFVYDKNTGLYYDSATGYYYDNENSLYYEPNTGTYFYYDVDSQQYQFHSQVDISQYTTYQNTTNGDSDSVPTTTTTSTAKPRKEGKKPRLKRQKEEKTRRKKKRRKTKAGAKDNEEQCNNGDEAMEVEAKDEMRKDGGNVDLDHIENENTNNTTVVMENVNSRTEIANGTDRTETGNEKDKTEIIKSGHENHARKSNNAGHGIDIFATNDDDVDETENEAVTRPKVCSQPDRPISVDLSSSPTLLDPDDRHKCKSVSVDENTSVDGDENQICDDDVIEISSDSDSGSESELESGEITESESSSGSDDSASPGDENDIMECQEDESNAVNWPPCIRVMVSESDVLDPGTLFIVTYPGGTIGREKDGDHVIGLPELNVSKTHAEIKYCDTAKKYFITDCGSQNGTFLNENRIAEPKSESEPRVLSHGDVLKVASTALLLHIHPGSDTCDDCEPGQVLAKLDAQNAQPKEIIILTKKEKLKLHRQQLSQIKKKYGLKDSAYVDNSDAVKNPAYADLAELRRQYVGSDNPHQKSEAPASIHRPITTGNKGHKMLKKMGWSEGEGLGKANAGIQEPVAVSYRINKSAGLGSGFSGQRSLDQVTGVKSDEKWIKARQRFEAMTATEGSGDSVPSMTSKSKTVQKQWVQGETVHFDGSEDASGANT